MPDKETNAYLRHPGADQRTEQTARGPARQPCRKRAVNYGLEGVDGVVTGVAVGVCGATACFLLAM